MAARQLRLRAQSRRWQARAHLTGWQAYSASVALAAGTHTLSVTDSAVNPCRTLYVDAVVFSAGEPGAHGVTPRRPGLGGVRRRQ